MNDPWGVYQRLLRLLPRSFRERHAAAIEEMLRVESAARGRGTGAWARARFWTGAILDLLAGILVERSAGVVRDGLQDIRYAGRALRRSPAFTAMAVIALAMGMGANTAVFTLVSEVALSPLPVHEPDRLVSIVVDQPGGDSFAGFSYAEYVDYRDRNTVLDGLTATSGILLTMGEGGPDAIGLLVSEDYFEVLGIDAALGRQASAEEVRTGAQVAVVSDGYWQRRAGGASDLIGSTRIFGGIPLNIIGILPPGFSGTFIGFPSEVFVPVTLMDRLRPGARLASPREQSLEMFARLRPDVTPEAADDALNAIAAEIERNDPSIHRDRRVHVYPLTGIDQPLQAGVSGFVLISLLLSSLVLLTACLNVGGLLLARASYRNQEMSIRAAIGASRGRIVRQLTTETVALFGLGFLAALFVAHQVNALLRRLIDSLWLPLGFELKMDWQVISFAAAMALSTALATGVVSALQASPSRHGGGGGQRRSSESRKIRSAILVLQVAVSLVLLMSAGLFLRAVDAGERMEAGFDMESLTTAAFGLPVDQYSEADAFAFYRGVVERMRDADPTARVSISELPPIGVTHSPAPIVVPGHEPPPGQAGVVVDAVAVGADYIETVGIPVLEGRAFERRDEVATQPKPPAQGISPAQRMSPTSPAQPTSPTQRMSPAQRVAVVNRAMAERLWPDQPAVGRTILEGSSEIRIVGVVENTRHVVQDPEPSPLMYLLAAQRPRHRMVVVIRSASTLGALNRALQAVVADLDDSLPPPRVQPADEAIQFFLLPQRAAGRLIGGLGLIALLLAIAGVYGVVSYAVGCRRRELGIRAALGGQPQQQVRLVMRGGLVLVIAGTVLGLIGVAAIAPLLRILLLDVRTFDPLVLMAATGSILGAALLASYLPARRAARIDPMITIRTD